MSAAHYHLVFVCLTILHSLHLQMVTAAALSLFLSPFFLLSRSHLSPSSHSFGSACAAVVKAFNIVCHFCQATPSIIWLLSTRTHRHSHTGIQTLSHTLSHSHAICAQNFPFFLRLAWNAHWKAACALSRFRSCSLSVALSFLRLSLSRPKWPPFWKLTQN